MLTEREGVVFRDAYGVRWRVRLVGERQARGRPVGEHLRAVFQLRSILYFVFGPGAAHWDAPTVGGLNDPFAALLSIYDALTGRRLASELVGPRPSPVLLARFGSEIEETLLAAAQKEMLSFEEDRMATAPVVVEDAAPTERTPSPIFEKLSFVALRVVDEVGEPIEGLDIAFGIGAERKVVPTDRVGIARLSDVDTGVVPAALANIAQVRKKLAPRWKKPRTPKLPTGDNVHVAQIDAAAKVDLSLEIEKVTTLAITPLFRCSELSGVHFAFERSFVLQSGLGTLSVMAAAILEDDSRRGMIFGHTDTSGSEALNKELSERRAKVIHAILTHDSDAWESLWTGTADGPNFREQWGIKEAQHLLNAFEITDDDGVALVEERHPRKPDDRRPPQVSARRLCRRASGAKPAARNGQSG